MRKNGTALLTALVATSILLTVGFTAAGVASSNLATTGRLVNAQTARNLAESAITLAIVRLQKTPAATQPVTVQFSGGQGWLSFDRNSGQAYSTNNLGSDVSVPGWRDTVVPGQAVHLVGQGRCGGLTHTVEAVVSLNRFRYAVASSGPVCSQGGLLVCSVDDASELDGGLDQAHQEAGSLASNSSDPQAVHLFGPGIDITGDIQATGGIGLGQEVVVGGALRPHEDPVDLPKLEIATLDTSGKPGLVNLPNDQVGRLEIKGFARIDRGLRVGNGLELKNGVLFVDGDLNVTGGLRGNGAVIVTGKTTVSGSGGKLGGDEKLALVSRGSIELTGRPDSYQGLQGLLYTEGDLSSRYLNLAGVFVANHEGQGSRVQLDDTRVFRYPASKISLEVSTGPARHRPVVGRDGHFDSVELERDDSRNHLLTADAVLDTSRLEMKDGQYVMPEDSLTACVWTFTDPATGQSMRIPVTRTGEELNPYIKDPLPKMNSRYMSTRISALDGAIYRRIAELNRVMRWDSEEGEGSDAESGGTETWTLDLSQFLHKKEQLRVLVWRDL